MLTKSPLNPRRSWIALAVALLSLSARSEALAAGAAVGTHVARALSVLQQGFESPPQSARPQVWWHWIGGNITRAGIRKDLEWMHRIGIGGVDQIQLSFFTPQIVKYPLAYLSPGWKAAFRDAADLTAQHGMQLSIDSSPGWSETGGPWVRPDEAMKKLVWTATVVVGGAKLRGMLPPPPANTGPLQDAPMSGGIMGPPKFSGLRFYRDALVVAYRAPVLDPRPVSATSSSGPIAALALTQLTDGRLTDGPSVSPRDGKGWIELRFPKPERLQGATIAPAVSSGGSVAVTLYASLDGASWSKVALMQPGGVVVAAGFPQTTVSFAPIVARYVRVDLRALPQLPLQGASAVNAPGTIPVMAGLAAFMGHAAKPPTFRFHELVLHSRATVNEFEAKAYFRIVPDYYAVASVAPVVPGTVVHADDVVNLTGRMKPDGTLDWMPPPGRWVVLRMGYSLEGTTNHPVSPAATGLEADKLSRRETWVLVAQNFQMDWQMLWKDLLLGFLIAGALAVFVPEGVWQTLFVRHASPWVQVPANALLGPLVAVLSFVCSIGNVPMAAVLWGAGVSFGGVLAFLYADLIVLPLLDVYRRYFGWKMAAYIAAVFYATMVAAAIIMDVAFNLLGWIPDRRPDMHGAMVHFSFNYTFWLNLLFGLLALALFAVARRHPMEHGGHCAHQTGHAHAHHHHPAQ